MEKGRRRSVDASAGNPSRHPAPHRPDDHRETQRGNAVANPDLLEAWYRLMAEAMRETADTQKFIDRLGEGAHPAEWMARWMKQRGADAPPAPEDLPDEWLEQWYKTMGVVPRSRYLKLLERHEALRQELDRARKKIERLGGSFDSAEQQEAAEDLMNIWKSTLDETMKAQSEWMRAFSEPPSDAPEEKDDPPGEGAADDAPGDASKP